MSKQVAILYAGINGLLDIAVEKVNTFGLGNTKTSKPKYGELVQSEEAG